MFKSEAIELFGTASELARAIGVTPQAVYGWKTDPLPQRIADRVQAALWRRENGIPHPKPVEREVA